MRYTFSAPGGKIIILAHINSIFLGSQQKNKKMPIYYKFLKIPYKKINVVKKNFREIQIIK
jgi:hypothetical protein